MAERADELYLPNAVLGRIIKDSLPERTIVNREARSAISKAVSSFILYVTSLASAHCSNAKRKTLTVDDIFAALKEMQFDHYLPMLTTFLQNCRSKAARKKLETQPTDLTTASTADATQTDCEILDETPLTEALSPASSLQPKLVDLGAKKTDDEFEDTEIEVDLTEDTDEEQEVPDEISQQEQILGIEPAEATLTDLKDDEPGVDSQDC